MKNVEFKRIAALGLKTGTFVPGGGNGMLSLVKLARLVLLRCRNQIKLSDTMSGEEIGLDFDIGIGGGNSELAV